MQTELLDIFCSMGKLVWEEIDYFSISSCSVYDKLLDYSFILSA